MRRNNRKSGGFTLTEILILIVIAAFFSAVFLRPNYVRSGHSSVNACINNLRIIDGAKDQWAMEHQKQNSDTPTTSDLQPYLVNGRDFKSNVCPDDPKHSFATSYSPNNVGTKPVCRIMPTNHILP